MRRIEGPRGDRRRSAAWATSMLLLLALAALPATADPHAPCPAVVFVGTGTVKLTDVESKLLCGDPDSEGWKKIPLRQAEYFMKAFLQQRGFLNPRFAVVDGRLQTDIGVKSQVLGFEVKGLPAGVEASGLRGVVGKDLTPKELDAAKTAAAGLLQDHGYPCPEVAVTADGRTGQVSAIAAPGAPGVFARTAPVRLENVDPRVFDRYRAFRYGQPFDIRLLTLTSERTLAESLFVSAYYDVACSTAGAAITQRVVEGKPRFYQFGAGFDTEGYLIGKAQWQKSRIGWRDSSLEGSLYASFREETAEASMHAYLDPASRSYLMPQVIFDREDQIQYQYVTSQASLQPGTSWDGETLRAEGLAGPAVEHITTVRGVGPANDTFLALKTKWTLTDHLYEFYGTAPRQGWRFELDTLSRVAGVYSSLTAHKLVAQGETLWNLAHDDPPTLVFGTRYYAGTTYVTDLVEAQQNLAPDMRFFLGGDANLRGVALNGLPSDQNGFFTVVYDGLELRMADGLPYGLQPLAFLDTAMAGRADVHLDPDVYWSPGLGLRWSLPVGSIRASVARGLLWHRDQSAPPLYAPHWQLFLSFGEEF